MARVDVKAINDTIRYTMWSVFRVEPGRLGEDRTETARQATEYLDSLANKDVTVRGVYDLAGVRHDADYMIWWHSSEIE